MCVYVCVFIVPYGADGVLNLSKAPENQGRYKSKIALVSEKECEFDKLI